jgi:outer membrane protein, heavy metal efflux system
MRPVLAPGWFSASALALACCAGCRTSEPAGEGDGWSRIDSQLQERTGHGLAPEDTEARELPPGVALEDGISSDEAVALALWNDAEYRAALADLGLARARVIEAGLWRDPVLTFLFPIGPKEAEFSIAQPLSELWQRHRRVEAARAEQANVEESLLQRALDLVHQIRGAWIELELAQQRASLLAEGGRALETIAARTEERYRGGDVAGAVARAARAKALSAAAEAEQSASELEIARERLAARLGLSASALALPSGEEHAEAPLPEIGELLEQVARPDLAAAQLALFAALERAQLADAQRVAVTAILDANLPNNDLEMGPGIELNLPVFNGNRGGRELARAEIESAARRYRAVRIAVETDVRAAGLQARSSRTAADRWRAEVLPGHEEAARAAEGAFAAGETSAVAVLEASLAKLQAQQRLAELEAAAEHARADLEHALGHALQRSSTPESEAQNPP